MPDYPSISKQSPAFPPYLDFQSLRRIGIDRVQQLSSKLWTDYNLHDPGVTILEVLCYAITDLGYRNNLEIEDLLALNLKDANSQEHNFFTPDRLLSCNPVTELDVRKRLIDIPGVRNAWLERLGVAVPPQQVENYEPAIYIDAANGELNDRDRIPNDKTAQRLNPQGLYRVCLDLEPDLVRDACGESYRLWAGILDEVKRVLCSYRNLCEDFEDVVVLGEEEIGLCAEIELEANADPEDVLIEIYVRVQAFLSPRLRFYTLAELLDRGQSPAEIFAGRPSALYDPTIAYRSNGFIDPAELAALTLPQVIHTSDLYREILAVAGVAAISKLSIVNYINGLPQSTGDPWCLHLTPKYRPVLGLAQSRVTFSKGNLPFKAGAAEVERRYYEQQAARIKSPLDRSELDLSVPQGNYYDLADHYSIHHDFPLTYGISEDGLPATAPPLRQGQANQLKGYLVFFDRILANYLAQLAHIRDLFSWEDEDERERLNRHHTYFTQALNLPGVDPIFSTAAATDDLAGIDRLSEDSIEYQERRNRFLDHLLARFAESFNDYVQLNYRLDRLDGGRRDERDIIKDKVRFLQEYPELSRDRFRAFNYCNCEEIWDTNNVSGFQKRVSRLLGTDIDPQSDSEKLWRRSLNHYQIIPTSEGYRFSLTIDEDRLESVRIYATQAAAQIALEEFLAIALNLDRYQKLTYRFYYHYGWEITDETKKTLVTYERNFPSRSVRDQSLEALLADLNGDSILSFPEPDRQGLISFQISVPDKPEHIFTSVEKYANRSQAEIAAAIAQQRIKQPRAYRGMQIGGTDRPKLFTYYGYQIVDTQGNLQAESTKRFVEIELRDRHLQSWLTSLQSNQNHFHIAGEVGDYYFYLDIPNAAKDRVRSCHRYPTEALAWQAARACAEHVRYLSRYTIQETGLGITDEAGNTIAGTDAALDRVEIFTLINRIDPLLQIERIPRQVKQKSTGYRFKLVDRQGETLLVGSQSQSTQKTTRSHFYHDVLSILFEDGAIELTGSSSADFSFQVVTLQTPAEILAIHSQHYRSATDRDKAIERLKLLVRTSKLQTDTPPQKPVNVGIITDPTGNILLQGIPQDETDCELGNTIVELAQTKDNFRLIDAEDGTPTYSWELTNHSKDRILAIPPQTFASEAERDKSIDLIQSLIDDEGFHVVEHILLRPRQQGDKFLPISKDESSADSACCTAVYDPYSFWISVILPYWPTRFRDLNFRQLVERTLRLEAPAHVGLKICWIDVCQMQQFEIAYRHWLEQLALDRCQGAACDLSGSLERLIDILAHLDNIYPEGTLHDCNQSDPNDNPIVLNQTALGRRE
jgi:hypothetical protein